MSTTAESLEKEVMSTQRTEVKQNDVTLDLRWAIGGCLMVFALLASARWYQGWASWDYGTDSTSPEFQTYWVNLWYAQIITIPILGVVSLSWLWRTRDKHLDKIPANVELRRYTTFLGMLMVYAFTFVFAGSFFAEQDAAWHQVVMRDTALTPSHIILFYGTFPLFIVLGFSSYMYATTRLPLYAKGISVGLVIATLGPMMVLPNVGYNEWGHAFWFMEEYFTAPLHWGFVFFGWAILGLGGILVTVMSRLSVIMPDVFVYEED